MWGCLYPLDEWYTGNEAGDLLGILSGISLSLHQNWPLMSEWGLVLVTWVGIISRGLAWFVSALYIRYRLQACLLFTAVGWCKINALAEYTFNCSFSDYHQYTACCFSKECWQTHWSPVVAFALSWTKSYQPCFLWRSNWCGSCLNGLHQCHNHFHVVRAAYLNQNKSEIKA